MSGASGEQGILIRERQPRPDCVCGQLCNCACHWGEASPWHRLPCCGEGSANHALYCIDLALTLAYTGGR